MKLDKSITCLSDDEIESFAYLHAVEAELAPENELNAAAISHFAVCEKCRERVHKAFLEAVAAKCAYFGRQQVDTETRDGLLYLLYSPERYTPEIRILALGRLRREFFPKSQKEAGDITYILTLFFLADNSAELREEVALTLNQILELPTE